MTAVGAVEAGVPGRPRSPRAIFLVANNIEEVGGLQRVVHTLAGGFAARGHRVELIGITPGPGGERIRPAGDYPTRTLTLRHEAVPWSPVGWRQRLNLAKQLKEMVRRHIHAGNVERLRAWFDAVDDGIVICAQVWAMQWVADAAPRHLRVIAMSHESYEASRGLVPTARGSTRYQRIMSLYPPVDSVLLLTEVDALKFERDGLCNVGVMHNPLPVWPERVSPLTAKRVVAIGRLEVEKRYDRLIEAWKAVAQRHPDWRLDIYGDGSLGESLRRQVREAGLEQVVSVPGSTSDVVGVLADASALALSSEQEGLPLVLVEAMACGVPCVAFDCAPGIREIIHDGEDGIVVRNRDVVGLAAAISRLIEEEQTRQQMGALARTNIERFHLDRVVDRWERLFEQVER